MPCSVFLLKLPCFPGYQTCIFFISIQVYPDEMPPPHLIAGCNFLLLSKKRSFLCCPVVCQWMNACFNTNMKQPHVSKEHCHATEVPGLSLGWGSSTITAGCERRGSAVLLGMEQFQCSFNHLSVSVVLRNLLTDVLFSLWCWQTKPADVLEHPQSQSENQPELQLRPKPRRWQSMDC